MKQFAWVEKWYVDFDKCLPFFNEHHGCARYAWQYALGARPVVHPLWLKRLSGGEHEKAFDFPIFLGCQVEFYAGNSGAFLTGSVRQ